MLIPGKPATAYRLGYGPYAVIGVPDPIDALELVGYDIGDPPTADFWLLSTPTVRFAGECPVVIGLAMYKEPGAVTIGQILGLGTFERHLQVLSCWCPEGIGLDHIEPPMGIALALDLPNNALPQADIDGLLAACVAAETEAGSVDLTGGTNAEPSAAGWADYDILVSRDWSVAVNGEHP